MKKELDTYHRTLRDKVFNDLLTFNKGINIKKSNQEKNKKKEILNGDKKKVNYQYIDSVDEIIEKYTDEEYASISVVLVSNDRVEEALELSQQIYDGDYLWTEHYRSFFNIIIQNAINNNDVDFIDKIEKVINQWIKLDDYVEYHLTFDEIMAQEAFKISAGYISIMKNKNQQNLNNDILKKILDVLEYAKKEKERMSEGIIIYYKVYERMKEVDLKDEASIILQEYRNIIRSPENRYLLEYILTDLYLIGIDHQSKDEWTAYDLMDLIGTGQEEDKEEDWYQEGFDERIMKSFGNKTKESDLNTSISGNFFQVFWAARFLKDREEIRTSEGVDLNTVQSGQNAVRPFLTLETVPNAAKSSALNVLFLRCCEINEYYAGKEFLDESKKLIREIDDITIKSRGWYLITTVLADAAVQDFRDEDINIGLLDEAFTYASLVNDHGEFRCNCGKYTEHRHMGIVCDRCGTSPKSTGYKKLAFEYILNRIQLKGKVNCISGDILESINDNFSKDEEQVYFYLGLLKVLLTNGYTISNYISQMLTNFKISSVEEYLNIEKLSLDQWAEIYLAESHLYEDTNELYEDGYSISSRRTDIHNQDTLADEEHWEEISLIDGILQNKTSFDEISLPRIIFDVEYNKKGEAESKSGYKESLSLEDYLDFEVQDIVENEKQENQFNLLNLPSDYDDDLIYNKIKDYLVKSDQARLQIVIPQILNIYLSLIKSYSSFENLDDFRKCIGDYITLKSLIKDSVIRSKLSLEIYKLIIDLKYIDEYPSLINDISNYKDLIEASQYYVTKYSLRDCILFSNKINERIRDDFLGKSMANIFINESNKINKNEFMYLYNFSQSYEGISTFIANKANKIMNNKSKKDDIKKTILSEILDIDINNIKFAI
jgi:hypothetical protein